MQKRFLGEVRVPANMELKGSSGMLRGHRMAGDQWENLCQKGFSEEGVAHRCMYAAIFTSGLSWGEELKA